MAYKISLDTDVTCYELLDNGKIFINKEISTYVDFTDKTVLQGVDVEEKFDAQGLDEKAIVLPIFSQIERIGDTALCGRNLQHVKFPGLLSIDAYGLRENNLLENIELDEVKRIGQGGFLDCKNLQTVRIGSNIEEIAVDAFRKSDPQDPQSIQNLTIDRLSTEVRGAESGFGLDDRTVIHFKEPNALPPPVPTVSGFLSVANNVRKHNLSDDNGQAYWNQEISAVVDFTDLTAIRSEDVEYRVLDITKKFVPIFSENLSAIHQAAFTTCKMHNFRFNDALTSIGDVALGDCTGLQHAVLKNIKTIGYGAFQGSDIPGVEFGKNLESIGSLAFDDCSKLSTVVFTNDIQNIGESAFPIQTSAYFTQYKQILKTYSNYPWGLAEVNIFAPKMTDVPSCMTLDQENLTKNLVERQAIANYTVASALTGLVIQSSCKTIASDAFSTCTNVTSAFFAERNINQIRAMGEIPFGLGSLDYIYPENEVVDLSTLVLHSTLVDSTAVDEALLEQGLTKDQVLTILFDYRCLSVQNGALTGLDNMTNAVFDSMNVLDIGNQTFDGLPALSSVAFTECQEYMVRNMPSYPFGIDPTNIQCEKKSRRTYTIWIDSPNVTREIVETELAKAGGTDDIEFADFFQFALTPNCRSIESQAFAGVTDNTFVEVNNQVTAIAADAFDNTCYVYFHKCESVISANPNYPFGLVNNSYWATEWELDLSRYTTLTQGIFEQEYNSQHDPADGWFSIRFNDRLTEIGPSCFCIPGGRSGIIPLDIFGIDLPASVEHVGECAFYGLQNIWALYCNAKTIDYHSTDEYKSTMIMRDNNALMSLNLPRVKHLDGVLAYNCSTLFDVEFPELSSIDTHEGTLPLFDNCPIQKIRAPKLKEFIGTMVYNDYSTDPENQLKAVEIDNAEIFGVDNVFNRLGDLNTVEYVRMPHVLSAYGWPYGESCLIDLKLPLATYVDQFDNLPELTGVHLPNVIEVGNFAFKGDTKLKDAYLPNAKTIGDSAFQNDAALLSLDLPMAENIGSQAFEGCTSLEKIRVKNNNTISMLRKQPNYPWGIADESKFVVQHDVSYNIILSDDVIDKAFVDNWTYEWNQDIPSISSLTIGNTCRRIESGAFENFTGLRDVTIPSTVEFVGKSAFYGCSNLTLKFANRTWEQMAAMPGYPFGLPTAKLRATTSKPKINSPLKLATDVECCKVSENGKIFVNASECAVLDGIAEVVTKDSIDEKLQDIALNRTTSFKIIACLSSNTTQLGDEAFAGLSNLYYVDFVDGHNNLTSIERASFKSCNVTSSIIFEAWNMHDIATCSAYPFGLVDDICLSATDMADVAVFDRPVGDNIFPAAPSCSFALIRKGCWKIYGYESKENYAFSNNPNLSTVICKWPCKIEGYAFYGCSALTGIDFPEVSAIGRYAFCGSYNAYYTNDAWAQLSSISLPKCVEIEDYAFYKQPNIETLDLPNVIAIGHNAFENTLEFSTSGFRLKRYGKSSKLKSIVAPKLQFLCQNAFRNCINLSSINMPELIALCNRWDERDAGYAFALDINNNQYYEYKDAPCLREVSLPKIQTLPEYTFSGQSELTSLNVPHLTAVNGYAIANTGLSTFDCAGLALYPYAFADTKFTTVDLKNATFEQGGTGIFNGCQNLVSVNMLQQTALPTDAFVGCNALTNIQYDKQKITYHGSDVFGFYDDRISPYAMTVKYLNFPNLISGADSRKFSCYPNLISANLPQMTYIDSFDFAGLHNFISVYMPKCKSIGERAFYETSITEFYVPQSVTAIDKEAFYNCDKLTDLSVQSGNNFYFSDKDGKHYPAIFKWNDPSDQSQGYQLWIATNGLSSLPDGLTEIAEDDLMYMKSLTSIYIPATLTGDLYHLRGLSALQAISVDQGNSRYTDMNGSNVLVEKYRKPHQYFKYINLKVNGLYNGYYSEKKLNISHIAFSTSSGYSGAFAGNNIIADSDGNIYSKDGDTAALRILDDNTETVFDYVPKAYPYTLSIELEHPVDLLTIGKTWYAWKSGNDSYPNSIEFSISQDGQNFISLGSSSYHNPGGSGPHYWSWFTSADLSQIQETYDDVQLRLLAGCGSSKLCGNIEIIETGAFAERNALTSLVCEDSSLSALKEIQSGAFDSCANLKQLKIACPTKDAAQIKVDYQAIKYNGSMLSLELTNISSFATTANQYSEPLPGCDNLEHIGLNGISAIPEYLCQAKANLKSAKFDSIVEVKTNSFNNCYELTSVSFGSELTAIRSGAFDGCRKLSSIDGVDHDRIKIIEAAAFRGTQLQNADFSQLTSIADYVFSGTQVSSINMPLLWSIGAGSFSNCRLTNIDLPNVYRIWHDAFSGNKLLTAVNLPGLAYCGGTGYNDGAFRNCDSLLSIALPNLQEFGGFQHSNLSCIVAPKAMSIADYAFVECSNLICVDVGNATAVGTSAFEGCTAMSSINLQNATAIGRSAFKNCRQVTEIKLPAARSLQAESFAGCSALTSIEFSSLREAASDAFSYSALCEITLPSTLIHLHMNAFNFGYTYWDDQLGTERVYDYEIRCHDLTSVWFKGRSYDQVISEIDREDYYYYDKKPYIYDKGIPYWGIDRKYIKLDNKYTSILKLAAGTKRYDLADGGIVYSQIPILDLT